MRITIVGAGLTGLTYGLLLKSKGYDVEIFEKRPLSDIQNLDSIIYIREKTLKILSEYIDEEIFINNSPKAFKEGVNPSLYIPEEHSCINIQDLLQALLNAADRAGIPVHRQFELKSFSRTEEGASTVALFTNESGNMFKIECDQLLLACGNHDIKPILKDLPYNQPIELHSTHVIGARIPIDPIDFKNRSSIGIYPDANFFSMIIAQIAALFHCETKSIGNLSVYLASLSRFIMMSTYPSEQYDEFSYARNQVNFLKEKLRNIRLSFNEKYKDMDYTWLEEMENKINEENVGRVTAYSMICLPDESLLKQGVILIGDAFVTTPFIFGSEYNMHVVLDYPELFNYLEKIRTVNYDSEINNARKEFIEKRWDLILNTSKGAGRLLKMPDLVGNTFGSGGSKVNPSPFIGYPVSRENLEELNKKRNNSWISIPSYQQGGFLGKVGIFAATQTNSFVVEPTMTSANLMRMSKI